MADIVRFNVQIPEWTERNLKLLARIRGMQRATLASIIIQCHVDEKADWIEERLEAIASLKGITKEELIKEWLNEED